MKTTVFAIATLLLASSCEVMYKPGAGTYFALGVDYRSRAVDLTTGTFTSDDANMSKSVEHVNRTINTLGTGMILANVQKAKDAATAANDATAIKEQTNQAKIAADLQKSKDANALKLAEMEMEMAAPAAAAPVAAP